MTYIDLHADTITKLKRWENLERCRRMVSLPELREAGCLVQFFSAFVPTGYYPAPVRDLCSMREYKRILKRFRGTLRACPEELLPVRSYSDVETCIAEKKTGLLFTIEDAGVLGHDPENLSRVYEDGVRLITLTWNHANPVGYPNSENPEIMKMGLTEFGFQTVERMEDLGILIDVSHLSDGGFWNVCHSTHRPFIASHSNAREVRNHPRNLTDEMIRAIAERGGVIGLNFYGKFLSADGVSRVWNMVEHVKHIYQVGGEDVLALGSDFDGINGKLEIGKPTEIEKLRQALKKFGFAPSVIEKMWSGNALRILHNI